MSKFARKIQKNTEKLLIDNFVEIFKHSTTRQEKLNKRFSFVLAGGKSPINLYKKLSKLNVNWKNIDFFWGDERFISRNSKFSNFKLIDKYLFRDIKVKQSQIFAIDTNKKSALFAAKNYEKKIKSYFKKKFFSFDLILLGMGMDGHIASLYPKDKDILSKKIVRNVHGEDFDRITIGLNLINKAKKICLWLPTVKKKKYYYKISNIKKKPVNLLKKNKMTIFSILR